MLYLTTKDLIFLINMPEKEISCEYIRGLIEGEGCFSFCKIGNFIGIDKKKIPVFALAMSRRDKNLIKLVKERLGLRNRVYEYGPRQRKDGYKRDGTAILMVRDIGQLKNIIVPLCYKKLFGNKGRQFEEWIEKIGSDPLVLNCHKLIFKLYKCGFYEKINKYDY